MTGLVFIPCAVILGATVFMFRRNRKYCSDEELRLRARPDLAETLAPFVGAPDSVIYFDQELLWSTIHEAGGVWAICTAAGAIATLAARRARDIGGPLPGAEGVFVKASYLRIIAMLCIFENYVHGLLPSLPRVFAGAMVRLFWDLSSSLQSIEFMV